MALVFGFLSLGFLCSIGSCGMLMGVCSGLVGMFLICSLGGCLLWFSMEGDFLLDQVSYLMSFLVLLVFYISLVSSVGDYKVGSKWKMGIEYLIFFVSLFSLMFFLEGGWMSLFFFYESCLIPTFWLILKWGYQPERLQAGVLLLMYGVCFSLPMMVTLLCMSSCIYTDSMLLTYLLNLASQFCEGHVWIWMFVFVAFLVKVPVFLLHSWLPKAHVEAPLSASMILAGVLLKLGVFGLIRFSWLLGAYLNTLMVFIMVYSLWGGVMSAVICCSQNDLKSLIAYSSISHMSFCVAGAASLSEMGQMASVMILFAHGICSPCMFSLAGCSYDMSGSRSVAMNKGVLSVFPLLSMFWFLVSSANMSCPPSLSFFGEFLAVSSIVGMSKVATVPMVMMCFLAGVYCLFLYSTVNHGSTSLMVFSVSGYSERYVYSWFYCMFVIFVGFVCLDIFLG